jgi:NADPH:quinone reductase-like Zn-dependent oxidoreductase
MLAYEVVAGNKSDALRRVDRAVPALGAREVRVRVKVVGLNYRDVMIAQGIYPILGKNPPIAVADGAGEVVAVGAEVTRFRVGDRVARTYFDDWIDGDPTVEKLEKVPGANVDGMLAQEVVVSEDVLVKAPSELSFGEIATLGCAGVTAWNALFVEGRVKPGQTVLLLGTGGVSIWALQLAKAAGLCVIVTSSSEAKLERARSLGADETINYRSVPEWQDEVLRRTGGLGVDLVLEVGGDGTLSRSIRATRVGGTVVIIGGMTGWATELDLGLLVLANRRLVGISVGSRAMFEDLNRFVEQMKIHPVIDRVFPFEQAREAQAYLESGGHFGKIVVQVGT